MFYQRGRNIEPVLVPDNYRKYVFPICGFELPDDKIFSLGSIQFINKKALCEQFTGQSELFSKFQIKTFAIVNLDYMNLVNDYENGYNSLALKLLKEVIGYLNIIIYKKHGIKKERKIMITSIAEIEMDDGLVPYMVFNSKNELVLKNCSKIDLILNYSELDPRLITEEERVLFQTRYEDRTELQMKIFKSFEYLYYTFNEIYTSERMIKYFIILNHMLREGNGKDLNRKGIMSLLNTLFYNIGEVDLTDDKFTVVFENLYERMRNDILHGILSPFDESSVVMAEDYYLLKKIVIELMILIINNKKICKLTTIDELHSLIKSSRGSR